MLELIKHFPRQVAFPERVTCHNMIQFIKKVDSMNSIKPKIYFSLYNCNEYGVFDNPLIDKISFDLDSDNRLENTIKITDYCHKHRYRYCIIFSTKGFWVHIQTKNYEKVRNPKDALRQAQEFIIKECGLKLTTDKDSDVDFHIIGDVARVSRMVGTIDTTRGLFCVSILKGDLGLGMEHIINIAKTQRMEVYWHNTGAFDISAFDNKINPFLNKQEFDVTHYAQITANDKLLSLLPPCIVEILTDSKRASYKARFYYTIYMKESGFDKTTCDMFAKRYFSLHPREDALHNNYNHYKKVKVIDLVYKNDKQLMPNCETLSREGYCMGKCPKYNSLYK